MGIKCAAAGGHLTIGSRIALTVAAVLLGCSAVTISGCHRGGGPSNGPQTSNPGVDSLIVSVDVVRRIAGLGNLEPDPQGDERQPHRANSAGPAPCQAVSDQQLVFGDVWTQFRGVSYTTLTGQAKPQPRGPHTGGKFSVINQAVGIYANTKAARDAFDKLAPQLEACSALHAKHFDFTVSQLDPSTVTITFTGKFEAATIYRVQSEYLLLVSALAVPHPSQTAGDIAEKITTRIH